MKSRIVVLLSLVLICANHAMAARLQSVQVKQQAGKTSLFFTLDSAIAHKVFTLTNPDRVVVDFENTNLAFNLNQLNLNNELIKLVRSGHPNPHTLRLVFEVRDAVKLRANPWKGGKHAFALDISANGVKPYSPPSVKPLAVSRQPVSKPVPVRSMPKKPLRDVVIVLDPGHGGKDPGASGPHRTAEKNITLAIALKLKQIIDRQPGMRAVLTRRGDYYVGLRERLNIARQYNGDVFVSIHADAFINQQSSGASVFALSQRGATSEAARWLAEKENYSELGGVNLKDLDDQSGLVREVLIDLSQTATIGASLHMGERVLRNLNTVTKLHNHKVEQARFMVLKSPDIPSILIETGFISNPREERNLTDSRYQTRLTQSIFQGLKRYFWDYPPHGSRIEAMSGNSLHLVRRGETLPTIASQYHVSMAALKSANHLSGNQVRAGQRLVIPSSWS
ncbi:AMIN domain-containing protein [Legionella taurinensis]|uniref:N-acetylmuramoyl-L-alanine amidase AmiC n=1 Tax=Legionella taurinensis TaxID=70611 RepID=A0AB38N3X5_9GAMM|nr:N-acetylmuramoyl-L-alanine amidase [Legionella taurinensis]MDX1838681.1 N-acetylmuramoyl-L-alanine amidase [Legionella taurinensis]PUT38812.1 N-acetylmuramoyl-L-alanine amidase [Legionella taurinensis]PUT40190.1 N-acetylmuramoyl-L-alanine amidase [Legionella taurinensis]PUT42496.1 N-acetylmuramoyl-L-alanine amidase [Legionella taurinensis]PUT45916.1 N-acetylmuramoyl-L-alanine amidase [Legionella taurinensis]